MSKPGQHFARVENSSRLQRVLAVIKDGNWHSTREIQNRADVCAAGECMSEIDKNGYKYITRRVDGHFEYKYIGRTVEVTTPAVERPLRPAEQTTFLKTGFAGKAVIK